MVKLLTLVRGRHERRVAEALTPRSQVKTLHVSELQPDPIARADRFFTDHPGIHKLLVVGDDDRLHGLFTLSDIERITQERAQQSTLGEELLRAFERGGTQP
jgi:IMP dehydrogenase